MKRDLTWNRLIDVLNKFANDCEEDGFQVMRRQNLFVVIIHNTSLVVSFINSPWRITAAEFRRVELEARNICEEEPYIVVFCWDFSNSLLEAWDKEGRIAVYSLARMQKLPINNLEPLVALEKRLEQQGFVFEEFYSEVKDLTVDVALKIEAENMFLRRVFSEFEEEIIKYRKTLDPKFFMEKYYSIVSDAEKGKWEHTITKNLISAFLDSGFKIDLNKSDKAGHADLIITFPFKLVIEVKNETAKLDAIEQVFRYKEEYSRQRSFAKTGISQKWFALVVAPGFDQRIEEPAKSLGVSLVDFKDILRLLDARLKYGIPSFEFQKIFEDGGFISGEITELIERYREELEKRIIVYRAIKELGAVNSVSAVVEYIIKKYRYHISLEEVKKILVEMSSPLLRLLVKKDGKFATRVDDPFISIHKIIENFRKEVSK